MKNYGSIDTTRTTRTILSLLLSLAISISFFPGIAFAQESTEGPGNLTYDTALFEENVEKIGEKEFPEGTDTELGIIDEAYQLTTDSFSEDTDAKVVATFLADILQKFEVDSVLVNGVDENDGEISWVIARFEEDKPYYVLYPKADIGAEKEDREAFLEGSDYIAKWTPDAEFATEEFIDNHPLSDTAYKAEEETAADEEAIPVEDEAADAEADTNEEAAAEADAKEKESSDKDALKFGATGTSVSTGSCGRHATYTITTTDWTNYTLWIEGSGPVNDYTGYSSTPWSSYRSRITGVVVDANITAIGDYAFYYMNNLTSVKFKGKKVNFIGKYAFGSCYSLPSIALPSGLSYIDQYAFSYCYNLSKVTFPASISNIGYAAFYGDSALSKITINSGTKYLDDFSIYNCADVYYRGTPTGWNNINGPNAISSTTKVHFAKSVKNAKITLKKSSYVFTSKAIKPAPVVKLKINGTWKTLKKGRDYKLTYKKNKNVGTATVTVTGINDYYASVGKTFKITKRSIVKAKVTGVKSKSYTGKGRTLPLVVKVKIGKKYVKLKKGRDYTVKYKNNKKLSTKKKTAQVIITGKGNYKGKITRKFKIIKGNPGLKFKKAKITRIGTQGAFTNKVTKKGKGKFKYTYTSSKPAVATVNKKTGKITPKKVGTTTITVKSKATKNFKGGKATFKLTIRALKHGELKYTFANYSTYHIPESTFRLFYNASQAKAHYYKEYNAGIGGVCFGMRASSSMLKMPGTGMVPANFKKGAKQPSALSGKNRFKSGKYELYDVIEAMHITQNAPACQKVLNKNLYNMGALVKSVKTGKPAVVGITTYWGDGGHAIVGYKVKKVNKTTDRLYVYDCNYPNSERYITLYKNKKGKYIDWYYFGEYSSGKITFISGSAYRKIWKNRKAANKMSQLYVSSDNFQIKDEKGSVVAEMKNGVFESTDDNIYLAMTFGTETKDNLVCMPSGSYEIVNTAKNEKVLEVTSIDENQSLLVSTSSDSVAIESDEAKGINTATFDPGTGEDYSVTVIDGTDGGSEPEEVLITGEGAGSEITLGKEDGELVTENAEDAYVDISQSKLP